MKNGTFVSPSCKFYPINNSQQRKNSNSQLNSLLFPIPFSLTPPEYPPGLAYENYYYKIIIIIIIIIKLCNNLLSDERPWIIDKLYTDPDMWGNTWPPN